MRRVVDPAGERQLRLQDERGEGAAAKADVAENSLRHGKLLCLFIISRCNRDG